MQLAVPPRHARPIPVHVATALIALALVACAPAGPAIQPAALATPQPEPTVPSATATTPAPTATAPQPTPTPAPLPLSQPGSYHTGTRSFSFKDSHRAGRAVDITVWYPAVRPAGSTASGPTSDAAPDLSAAPYPLILSSAKVGLFFAPHLASHGFVVAGLNSQDSSDRWGLWLIDYPLDIVFALQQIASTPLAGLEGVVDADRAGAMGYSFDGYTSLALSGARVDPQFYLAQCAAASARVPTLPAWWIEYICMPADTWDALVAHAGPAITSSADGLWRPMTDARIRAVMPMAPEGAWLFGERGLAAVDRPTLIVGATQDDVNPYDLEATYIFEHLGAPNRALISFVGKGHMMIFNSEAVARMRHFATAFFGYHLQRRDDYASYISEDFVAQHDDLAWGVYAGK